MHTQDFYIGQVSQIGVTPGNNRTNLQDSSVAQSRKNELDKQAV